MALVSAAVVASVLAAAGVYLLLPSSEGAATPEGPAGAGPPANRSGRPGNRSQYSAWKVRAGRLPGPSTPSAWLTQAGLEGVTPGQFVLAVTASALLGGAAMFVIFGGLLPAVLAAAFAATLPVTGWRRRRRERFDVASAAWPRLLEEIRLRTGSLGRSIPQALFEAGRSAPPEWRSAFAAAEREWLLTTDLTRTLELLKRRLDHPTADVVCETLLIGYEIGGTDVDARLADLIEDRMTDLESRRDAASRQAGVRFARRFVLVVPLGMALAGLSIGSGRAAYATPGGQLAVIAGLMAVVACWLWSGRIMRTPPEPRVFM